jgi:hypothetical protein
VLHRLALFISSPFVFHLVNLHRVLPSACQRSAINVIRTFQRIAATLPQGHDFALSDKDHTHTSRCSGRAKTSFHSLRVRSLDNGGTLALPSSFCHCNRACEEELVSQPGPRKFDSRCRSYPRLSITVSSLTSNFRSRSPRIGLSCLTRSFKTDVQRCG